MNILLIFFALPIATIILAGIFQTIINCPYKIAGIAFAIFLIVAFALGGTAELIIAAIVYTFLALITALIVMFIQDRCNMDGGNDNSSCGCSNNDDNSSCGCGNNSNNNSSCGCGCRNNNSTGCGCRNR